jgi:hypothetical protein
MFRRRTTRHSDWIPHQQSDSSLRALTVRKWGPTLPSPDPMSGATHILSIVRVPDRMANINYQKHHGRDRTVDLPIFSRWL